MDGNINAYKHQDILEDILWPVVPAQFPGGGYTFQNDNAPVYRARSTVEYKTPNHIPSLSWPAQPLDLNIIENLWLLIKRKLQSRKQNINSSADLFQEIQNIWFDITPQYVQSLYNSIPRRIMQVMKTGLLF